MSPSLELPALSRAYVENLKQEVRILALQCSYMGTWRQEDKQQTQSWPQ